MLHLEWFSKTWIGDYRNWKSKNKLRQSRLQHCQDWPEYKEESYTNSKENMSLRQNKGNGH